MANKTITLDREAYERLKSARRANESFSDVVKRVLPKPIDLDEFLRRLAEYPLSDEAADALEGHLARRRGEPSRRRR